MKIGSYAGERYTFMTILCAKAKEIIPNYKMSNSLSS
jgi:hypothetical protein